MIAAAVPLLALLVLGCPGNETDSTTAGEESVEAAATAAGSVHPADHDHTARMSADQPVAGNGATTAAWVRVDEPRIVPTGRPVYESSVASSPGYVPLKDPEIEAVWTGKRQVSPIDAELEGGEASLVTLCQRIIQAVNRKEIETLNALAITRREFETILWPEFPQSRPATHITAEEAWGFVYRNCYSGAQRGINDFMDQSLVLNRIGYEKGVSPYANFTLHRGVVLHCTAASGAPVEVDFAHTIVERHGRYKVYVYKD